MMQLRRAWNYLLIEPFSWLICYFLNIDTFIDEFYSKNAVEQRSQFLRFMLPMFLIAYLLAFLLGFSFYSFHFYWPNLVLSVIGTISGLIIGIVWDRKANIPVGILSGIWFGVWLGMWSYLLWSWGLGVLLATIGGIVLGTAIEKENGPVTAQSIKEFNKYIDNFNEQHVQVIDNLSRVKGIEGLVQDFKSLVDYGLFDYISELIGIALFFFTKGSPPPIEQNKASRMGRATLICLAVSTVSFIVSIIVAGTTQNSIALTFWWGLTIGSLAGILAAIILHAASSRTVLLAVGTGSGIAIGGMLGDIWQWTLLHVIIDIASASVTAIAYTTSIYIIGRIVGKTIQNNSWPLIVGIVCGTIAGNLASGGILLFPLCYIISYYYRLPLSFMNYISISEARATLDDYEFFTYFRDSPSLYWQLLPLNESQYVMQTLIKQDIEQAVEMIAFIEAERPYQIQCARKGLQTGLLDIIESELETKKTLRDISEVTEQITGWQSLKATLHISDWAQQWFAQLNDICLDATRYRNSLGWQARYDALRNMVKTLRNLSRYPYWKQNDLVDHWSFLNLNSILNRWQGTAQHELDKLQQESQKTDQINNPYVVGQVLKLGTSLFVGRQDLVQQLEQGLSRGSHRPTFFLNGERRMGKSSTLRQLPHLLDARHFLPIFFDLQAPEMTASISAFFETIAEKMTETIATVGLPAEPLEKQDLQEAQRKNEAQVYYVFNEWLKGIEDILEQHDRIVLLSLDEFENLEMVGQAKYLDLHLLLNWFRSVLQNRPRLALLFSGGKSVSEMGIETGINWSGYFVNVQTFYVSFLRESEARQLITQPVPDYPIERIFGEGVVDEIIRVTGCHPFLVQAVCSNLVNNLNADGRDYADMSDVDTSVSQVLEDWEDSYFQDLWKRTDQEQRACLTALNELGQGNLQQIVQQMSDSKEVTRGTLQTIRHKLQILLKRDLVVVEKDIFRIATPIFSQWIERNSY